MSDYWFFGAIGTLFLGTVGILGVAWVQDDMGEPISKKTALTLIENTATVDKTPTSKFDPRLFPTSDTLIPAEEAWGRGAYDWSTQQRLAFTNDPANQTGSFNDCQMAKRKTYLATQHGLTMNETHKRHLVIGLGTCRFR